MLRRSFLGGIAGAALLGGDALALTPGQRVVIGTRNRLVPFQTGLNLWLSASSIIGKSDGDTVSTWPDLSGNSNNGTAVGTPIYRANVQNGQPGIEFITAGRRFVTPSFLSSSYDTSLTIYGVVKHLSSAFNVWAANGGQKLYCAADNSTTETFFNTSALTQVGTPKLAEPSGTAYLTQFRYDGSKKVVGSSSPVNQSAISLAATGNLGLSGALTIGDFDTTGFEWNGQICELLVYKAALSAAQNAQTRAYLCNKYALYLSMTPQVYCDGNSLTVGYQASSGAAAYPAVMAASLAAGWNVANIGVNGNTTPQRITADTTVLYPYYNNETQNIAILWEITNDLCANQNAATAYTNVVTWCTNARTAGFKVIVVTCISRGGGTYTGFEADRQTVNGNIRTNWATFADGLLDLGNSSTPLGGATSYSNATYFNADDIHLTDIGYAYVAAQAQTAVLAL